MANDEVSRTGEGLRKRLDEAEVLQETVHQLRKDLGEEAIRLPPVGDAAFESLRADVERQLDEWQGMGSIQLSRAINRVDLTERMVNDAITRGASATSNYQTTFCSAGSPRCRRHAALRWPTIFAIQNAWALAGPKKALKVCDANGDTGPAPAFHKNPPGRADHRFQDSNESVPQPENPDTRCCLSGFADQPAR